MTEENFESTTVSALGAFDDNDSMKAWLSILDEARRARESEERLAGVLKMAQSLADDAVKLDDGWYLPWTRHSVEVFSEIANAIAAAGVASHG